MANKKIWSVLFTFDRWNRAFTDMRKISVLETDFVANDLNDAKLKILQMLQKKMSRFQNQRHITISGHASRLITEGKHKGSYDGDCMLRLRHKFTSYKILKVKPENSNIAFVVGYGPKQAEELNQ